MKEGLSDKARQMVSNEIHKSCPIMYFMGGGFATYEDEVERNQSVEARRFMTSNIAPKAWSLFAVFNELRFTQPYGGDVSTDEVQPKRDTQESPLLTVRLLTIKRKPLNSLDLRSKV